MSNVAFKQNGEIFEIAKRGEGSIHMELPSNTFEVMFHPMKGFWLERTTNMTITDVTYGDDSTELVNRAMRSFDANKTNLGVALIGRKGSGKTRTLKLFAGKAIEMMMPVIIISQAFSGPDFNEWIGQIEQPIMLAFDEFDKTYAPSNDEDHSDNPRSQDGILALLQGTVSGGKKLFVFTANKDSGISNYLKNRPGRIRYTKYYEGLSQSAIIDYATKHLADKSDQKVSGLLGVSRLTQDFSFDMLQAIVNEMNLFKEDAYKAAELMVTQTTTTGDDYILRVMKDGELIERMTSSAARVATPDFEYVLSHEKEAIPSQPDNWLKVKLGAEHFKGFGETIVDAIYEKDGYEYHFLLVPPLMEGKVNQLLKVNPSGRNEEWQEITTARYKLNEKWRKEQEEKNAASGTPAPSRGLLFGGMAPPSRAAVTRVTGEAGWESLKGVDPQSETFHGARVVLLSDRAVDRSAGAEQAQAPRSELGPRELKVSNSGISGAFRGDFEGDSVNAGIPGMLDRNPLVTHGAPTPLRRTRLIEVINAAPGFYDGRGNRVDPAPQLDMRFGGPVGYAPSQDNQSQQTKGNDDEPF